MLNSTSIRILKKIQAINRIFRILSFLELDTRFIIKRKLDLNSKSSFKIDENLLGVLTHYNGKLQNVEIHILLRCIPLPDGFEEVKSKQLLKKINFLKYSWASDIRKKLNKYVIQLYESKLGAESLVSFLSENNVNLEEISESLENIDFSDIKKRRKYKKNIGFVSEVQKQESNSKSRLLEKKTKMKRSIKKISKSDHLKKIHFIHGPSSVYKLGEIITNNMQISDADICPTCGHCDVENDYPNEEDSLTDQQVENTLMESKSLTNFVDRFTQTDIDNQGISKIDEFDEEGFMIERGFKINRKINELMGMPLTKDERRLQNIYKRYDSVMERLSKPLPYSNLEITLPEVVFIKYSALSSFEDKEQVFNLYESYVLKLSEFCKWYRNQKDYISDNNMFSNLLSHISGMIEKINYFIGTNDKNYSSDVILFDSNFEKHGSTSKTDKNPAIQDVLQIDESELDFNFDNMKFE